MKTLGHTFHIVPLPRVEDFLRVGWRPCLTLDGTIHGQSSVLVEWFCARDPVIPIGKKSEEMS